MSGATENADGSSKWNFGKAIINGEVQLTSVSALEKADMCLRRYIFQYVHKIKEDQESSESLVRGNRGHADVQKFLQTGERSHLDSLVLQGLHLLPTPGPDLCVEEDMIPVEYPEGAARDVRHAIAKTALDAALLRANGIPVTGAMDLIHERLENPGVSNIADALDPPGVLKIVDQKFPYAMSSGTVKADHELVETLQMSGYGMWAFLRFPGLERVRLSHNYFPVKGNPKVSTVLVDREQVERTWKRADAIGGSMRDAARETDPNKVTANTRACMAFNRECPAKVAKVCTALDNDPLSFLIGGTSAERILAPATTGDCMSTPPIAAGSLVARLQAQRAAAAAQPAPQVLAAPPLATPALGAAPVVVIAPDVQAAMARLQAEEAAAIAAQAAPQMSLAEIIDTIESCGFGCPSFAGVIAQEVLALAGQEAAPGSTVDGSGEYKPHTVSTREELLEVLDDARATAAKRDAAPPVNSAPATTMSNLLPNDVPASNPAFASQQTETPEQKAAKEAAKLADKEAKKAAKKAEKEAAKEAAKLAAQAQVPVPVPPTDIVVATVPMASVVASIVTDMPTAFVAPVAPTPSTRAGAVNFLVDVAIEGLVGAKPLWPIIHELTDRMNKECGERDFRFVDKDSKYAFGGWKGVLTAAVIHTPMITEGTWLFNGMFGDIGSVVAEALRKRASLSGGYYIQGAR